MAGLYRILSLDGGGIRGLLTAVWLNELERRLGKPISGYFDMIAGTSTGSILACAIASNIPTETIIDLYVSRGAEIFPTKNTPKPSPTTFKEWFATHGMELLNWLKSNSSPKYDGTGLNKALQDTVKDRRFGDLQTDTVITSYNTHTRNACVLKSFKAAHKKLRLWEICRASSAAPTFFPAHLMEIENEIHPLIDGGIVANNPSAIAVAEALLRKRSKGVGPDKLLLASFGTGTYSCPITGDNVQSWGSIQWLMGPPEGALIDILMDGSVDATDYIVRQLISKKHFFRFQTTLDATEAGMDNVDPSNLGRLQAAAKRYLKEEGGVTMDRLVEALEAEFKKKK